MSSSAKATGQAGRDGSEFFDQLDLFDLTALRWTHRAHLLRWDAPAPRPGRQPRRRTTRAVPRQPTTGLDPRGRLDLWRLIEDLTAGGTSVLLTTQYLEEADHLADIITVLDRGRVIATGTASDLKARVGGDRLELHAAPGEDPRPLAAALDGPGTAPATVDTDTGRILIPVADGPTVLPDLAARLADTGLAVADLTLRRPTLDDVFLILTGTPSTPDIAAVGSAR